MNALHRYAEFTLSQHAYKATIVQSMKEDKPKRLLNSSGALFGSHQSHSKILSTRLRSSCITFPEDVGEGLQAMIEIFTKYVQYLQNNVSQDAQQFLEISNGILIVAQASEEPMKNFVEIICIFEKHE